MESIKITRSLDVDNVRRICVRYNLYTLGSNEDYLKMFKMARSAKTDADFLKVADNIWQHSDGVALAKEDFEFTTLVWYILNDCCHANVKSNAE